MLDVKTSRTNVSRPPTSIARSSGGNAEMMKPNETDVGCFPRNVPKKRLGIIGAQTTARITPDRRPSGLAFSRQTRNTAKGDKHARGRPKSKVNNFGGPVADRERCKSYEKQNWHRDVYRESVSNQSRQSQIRTLISRRRSARRSRRARPQSPSR